MIQWNNIIRLAEIADIFSSLKIAKLMVFFVVVEQFNNFWCQHGIIS